MTLVSLGQGADLLGENFPFFRFNDDDPSGAEKFESSNPGQRCLCQSLGIGRIKKNQIKGSTFRRECQRCGEFAAHNLRAFAHAASIDIGLNDFDRFRMCLDKHGALRAATQGFEGESAGAGEEIKNFATVQGSESAGEDAEEGFPHPIRRRSDPCAGKFDQFLPACSSAYDPQWSAFPIFLKRCKN